MSTDSDGINMERRRRKLGFVGQLNNDSQLSYGDEKCSRFSQIN